MTRLRFVSGISLPAGLWGGDSGATFGGPMTWGQAATDPIDGLRFAAFPWPEGYPHVTAWRWRVGDTEPDLTVAVASAEGPIDPTPIDVAMLVLDRVSGPPHQIVLYLTILADRFHRSLRDRDFDEPGYYRGVVRLVMTSGRVLTVPFDDRLSIKIVDRHHQAVP